jgi:hypothetical protein
MTETYLSLLDGLRRDNGVAGAVVTTHKVRLLRAGRARFAWPDPLALACQEVNAIRGPAAACAAGMGKDRPGSPVTSRVRFPPQAVIWELNYHGDLRFLDHARRQAAGSGLQVHDGWQLFCHGWAAALTAVPGLPTTTASATGSPERLSRSGPLPSRRARRQDDGRQRGGQFVGAELDQVQRLAADGARDVTGQRGGTARHVHDGGRRPGQCRLGSAQAEHSDGTRRHGPRRDSHDIYAHLVSTPPV